MDETVIPAVTRSTDNFESVLERDGVLLYKNKGRSMLPLLRQDRDLMLIIPKGPDRCGRLDAVLFRRPGGRYVLHRILKVTPQGYWIAGDNCFTGENVSDDQILGVLKAVIRDGRTISADAPLYRLYVHLWCDAYPLRMLILRCGNLAGRLIRTLKNRQQKRNG